MKMNVENRIQTDLLLFGGAGMFVGHIHKSVLWQSDAWQSRVWENGFWYLMLGIVILSALFMFWPTSDSTDLNNGQKDASGNGVKEAAPSPTGKKTG